MSWLLLILIVSVHGATLKFRNIKMLFGGVPFDRMAVVSASIMVEQML